MTLRGIEHSMRVCAGHGYNRRAEQVCRAVCRTTPSFIHSIHITRISLAATQLQLLQTLKAVTIHPEAITGDSSLLIKIQIFSHQ